MTEAESRYRAAEAQRLLDEPLLQEAFAAIEEATIANLLACRGAEPEDDRKRRSLVDRLNIIRDIRSELASAISLGKVQDQSQVWV